MNKEKKTLTDKKRKHYSLLQVLLFVFASSLKITTNNITNKRRHDLKGLNNHLVIIDILDKKHTRLMNI